MDWNAVGALGEVTGALLVGATLAYLGIQIRLTRRAWIRQNERDLTTHAVENCALFVNNPDMPGIHLRGMEDSSQLSDEERMRWHMFLWPFLAGLQEAVEDRETGIFGSSEHIDVLTEGAANVFRTPGGKAWWEQNQHLFRPGFREYMSSAIAAGSFTGLDITKF